MDFLIEFLVNAGLAFMFAFIIPGITIKRYVGTIITCLLVGLVSACVDNFIQFQSGYYLLVVTIFLVRVGLYILLFFTSDRLFKGITFRSWNVLLLFSILLAFVAAVIDKVF